MSRSFFSPRVILASIAVAGLSLFVSGSPTSSENLKTPKVYSSCKNVNDIAMTFDDGPWIYLRNISDAFTDANAKATFFFNGYNYDCIYNPDRMEDIKYAHAAGHMLGSHTWSHGDLSTFSTAQIQDSMYRMEEALIRIAGVDPAFMRPPYGSYNKLVTEISRERGQSIALWDDDTEDSEDNSSVERSRKAYQSIVSKHSSTALILEHEPDESTAYILVPYAIKFFQKHGFNLVTLAECLGVAPYQWVGEPQTPDSSWSCKGAPPSEKACKGDDCKSGFPSRSSPGSRRELYR